MKKIGILGSTGSIGTQAISLLEKNPELYKIDFLTAGSNWELLLKQAHSLNVDKIAITNPEAAKKLAKVLPSNIKLFAGEDQLVDLVSESDTQLVLSAFVGFAGVRPTLAALETGKHVALANKESLVSAGELITSTADNNDLDIIAVDSEHSAILQCLAGEDIQQVEKLILTASGGPFRNKKAKEFDSITVQDALNHPNWDMGNKITIDSATLMNKGLEVIEAYWLFGIPEDKIDVIVHPQSIIHSMVQFQDGSVKAQMGIPEMTVPIAYALSIPNRLSIQSERMDLINISQLDFQAPDYQRFPSLKLAFQALKTGSGYCNALNASNEIAVEAFLKEKIKFNDIPKTIDFVLQERDWQNVSSLESVINTDTAARKVASQYIASIDL